MARRSLLFKEALSVSESQFDRRAVFRDIHIMNSYIPKSWHGISTFSAKFFDVSESSRRKYVPVIASKDACTTTANRVLLHIW